MARTHSHKRGKSHSTRPPALKSTSWITMSQKDVEDLIVKMAHEGLPPSIIGERLRDEYGIPSVKKLIGKSVVDVLREGNVAPPIPEDLNNLLRKARRIMDHLNTFHSDRKSKHALELVEASIYRLANYYKRKGVIPNNWQYKAVVAQLA
ncbi:MAG TPA: 30S ribosomal protein S15 [Nitrososphaeria archaeon]|mgnify:FL=1|nr:30S ribosomal protein S15 [Conexivisphaerales archaeon]PMP95077.1 MAG: 30S ribosomal protein S15 [Nitrososphaera sp.]HEU16445.1 30S ribosomal protein S15 [Nitrososphaeria archaeon]